MHKKVLLDLNLQIQSVGPLMEESTYYNYEDPSGNVKELFPRYKNSTTRKTKGSNGP